MNLTYRPAAPSEVSAFAGMLPDGFLLDDRIIRTTVNLWRSWRQGGFLNFMLVEQIDDLGNASPVAFGASVFVTDSFVSSIHKLATPPLLMALIQSYVKGENTILSVDQIRVANSTDGLNLLIPIIGWLREIEDPSQLSRIKAKLLEAFYYAHAGYNVKDTIQEVYGSHEMKRAIAAGATVRLDYFAGDEANAPADPIRPYLIGVSRDEAVEGTYLHPLYLFNPPRFMFTSPEQSVLELAILDMSDFQIAKGLNLGEATIKKRWRSIFERASSVRHVPWLPPEAVAASSSAKLTGRGLEKRRHIVSYVRTHLEELRPYAPRKD